MLRLRLSMTESTCRPLAKKKQKKKSHLGSPQDDTDKDVSICVQTLREIG